MPRKLSSKLAETNARIDAAVAALQDKKFKSVYAAAKHFKIDRSTLMRRFNGGATHTQSRESTQLLSKAEEEALVLWIKRLTAGGYPASHRIVREMAWEILMHRVVKINTTDMQLVNILPIGKEWVKQFARQYPNLGTVRSHAMDFTRWKDATTEAINDWFDAFESTVATYQISDSNIYNMDETGFAIRSSQSNRVIIDTTLRTRYKVEPGRQEWVSIVECISGDGTVLPPLVIFKVKMISNNWITGTTSHDWVFSTSAKG